MTVEVLPNSTDEVQSHLIGDLGPVQGFDVYVSVRMRDFVPFHTGSSPQDPASQLSLVLLKPLLCALRHATPDCVSVSPERVHE